MISRADNRSLLQVAFFASNAVYAARQGRVFEAGRQVGIAEQMALAIDDPELQARGTTLCTALAEAMGG
jgi:hypothetical protein